MVSAWLSSSMRPYTVLLGLVGGDWIEDITLLSKERKELIFIVVCLFRFGIKMFIRLDISLIKQLMKNQTQE